MAIKAPAKKRPATFVLDLPPSKRKYTRFNSEEGTLAQYSFDTKNPKAFKAKASGLVVNEAYGGCMLVVHMTDDFRVGRQLYVKIGDLAPLLAEVRWTAPIEQNTLKVGLNYLE